MAQFHRRVELVVLSPGLRLEMSCSSSALRKPETLSSLISLACFGRYLIVVKTMGLEDDLPIALSC